MPDLRLAKTRASLPEGYQFGDAADHRDQHAEPMCGGDAHEHYFQARWLPDRLVYHGICRTCGLNVGEVKGLRNLSSHYGIAHWTTIKGEDHAR